MSAEEERGPLEEAVAEIERTAKACQREIARHERAWAKRVRIYMAALGETAEEQARLDKTLGVALRAGEASLLIMSNLKAARLGTRWHGVETWGPWIPSVWPALLGEPTEEPPPSAC